MLDKLIFTFVDPELNMILEDTIVNKLINLEEKQICLSVGQTCPPINSGAKMSSKTSLTSSVVASLAPPVCEALHLSKHISPGLARGRLKNEKNGWRSELRKLRNKVYVRMFSGQSASKCLSNYRAKAEGFMEALKENLSKFEVDCLKRRLEKTEHAVAASGETKVPVSASSYQSKVSNMSPDFPSKKNITRSSQSKALTLTSGFTSLKEVASNLDTAMDAVSEAMVTILTLATSGEHSAMIDSFIGEALDIMSAAKEDSNNANSEIQKSSMSTSSEIWGIEEKPVPILVPVDTQPSPILGQVDQVHPQAVHGGATNKVNRLGRLLGNVFPWKIALVDNQAFYMKLTQPRETGCTE